ncbi:Trypanosomal VSG domain containing protein, putative [Trypanosoma equiperdum]|uniref:Trypanosomal VSG domain containing protein, putative n=1 Tax=Trypanosoma equiperdum TaxID=5694 RepID=A0A1G4IDX9_TRYEQ|nr:Trypanosomal VSG domain containing protein, putative [Trypanosoma equiperdum]
MINFILALLLASQSPAFKATEAANGDGTNAADFAVLCTLERLASADIEAAYPKVATPTAALTEIREIVAATTNTKNITQVPADSATDEQQARQQACPTSAENAGACISNWNKWREVKKNAALTQQPKYPPLPIARRENPAATGFIRALHDIEAHATTEHSNTQAKAEASANPAVNEAKTKLTNAKFGAGINAFKEATGNAEGHGKGDSRRNACKAPNTGTSLVHDLICLCVPDNTATGAVCGVTANQCGSGGLEACTGVQAACEQTYNPKLAPATIRSALAAFTTRLKHDSSADIGSNAAVFLGLSNTQACGGAAGKLCVDYSHAFKDQGRQTGIYWYRQMAAAADDLETLEKEQASVRQGIAKLEQLAEQARQLYSFVALAPQGSSEISDKPKQDTATSCDTHKANSTCTAEPNCQWTSTTEDKGDHCKPKTKTATTAAGTKEGAAVISAVIKVPLLLAFLLF